MAEAVTKRFSVAPGPLPLRNTQPLLLGVFGQWGGGDYTAGMNLGLPSLGITKRRTYQKERLVTLHMVIVASHKLKCSPQALYFFSRLRTAVIEMLL